MASLALGAVGAVVGGAIGGPSGAMAGWNVGVTLGGVLFPPKLAEQNLGKLDDLRLSGSGYGAMIPQIWGKVRIGGNTIWSTDLVEHVQRKKQKGKGGGGQTVNTYTYTVSLAVAVCRGEAIVNKIWAEDLLIFDNLASPDTKYNITNYIGDETQTPDPLMESNIGAGLVSAHRGLCYVVFEDFLLTDWGNRIPNFSFEVYTPIPTVEDILTDITNQCDIDPSDIDFSDATDIVRGFVLAQRAAGRDIIDPLLRSYSTDLTEFGGQLKSIKRGNSVAFTISEDDLGAIGDNSRNARDKITTRILMDTDLPFRVDLTYFSESRLFQQMTQSAVRQSKGLVSEALTINSLLVLTEDEARQIAEKLIYTLWLERTTYQFALGPKFFRMGPGDLAYLPVNGENKRVRIIGRDAGLFGELRFSATLDEEDVLTQVATGGESPVIEPILQQVVDTHFYVWSCPILRDEDRSSPGFYVAATGPNQWKGCTVYYSSDAGVNWIDAGVITDRSVIGEVTAVPDDFEEAEGLDTASTLTVELTDTGELETTSQINVELGENASLVGEEVLGFATTDLTSPLEYDLTNLTRGFRDTEMTGHIIGEKFVLLEETGIRVEVPTSLIGETLRVKCVSDGQTLGGVTPYEEVTICDPSAVSLGGRLESWIVQAADTHLSGSDLIYTRELHYYCNPNSLWLSVRGKMYPFSSHCVIANDGTGKPKILQITFTAGNEFNTDDEIGIFYHEYNSPILAMVTEKFVVSIAGDQVITIPETPKSGSVRVWFNEQWLPKSAFSVSGDELSVPDGSLGILVSDVIFYAYTPDITPITAYYEDVLTGINGTAIYNAVVAPAIIDGNSSYVVDLDGVIDPDATIADDGAGNIREITLSVDVSAAGGKPITIRRYS